MHAVLRFALDVGPFVGVLGCVGWLGYHIGAVRTSTRIARSLRTDRDVGLHILEELAERWGVKIERQETPGGA